MPWPDGARPSRPGTWCAGFPRRSPSEERAGPIWPSPSFSSISIPRADAVAAPEKDRQVRLGPGGEFDLIRRFLGGGGSLRPEVLLGPGDDAAVLEGGWILSTDLTVEDVHFRRAWLTDEEVGYRAAAAAVSDLAAMAAEPVGVLVSMAFPRDRGVDVEAVQRGVRAAAEGVGASVLGGDLSRSPGPLVLDLTVVGRPPAPVSRAGALPGDELWVTGRLGASGAAVILWRAGQEPPARLRSAFARPTPRVEAALALARAGVLRALVDLSDGLAGAAGHLAAAGRVRVVLERERIPLAEGVEAVLGPAGALEAALRGGEDYELCFASPPGRIDAETLAREAGVALTRVGRVEAGSGVWLEETDGSSAPLLKGGYDHLDGPRA
ncbi:MAG: thiamine-phosphate kinase [Gemmatimonadetes bacterium]|nr:thiamine-phosphate kinase [Gemmatimonadota bacterium]